jgi:Spy/CpxP family protein refolding chaperone
MKRTILALLVVTLLVAGTAFGVACWLRCRSCAPASGNLTRELNLTDAQAAEVAKLDADYEKRLGEICATHCAARADLSKSLDDPAKAAACCQRMCAAQTQSEKLALEQVFKIQAILTPEQQARHLVVVRQQLTGACPMRVRPARH